MTMTLPLFGDLFLKYVPKVSVLWTKYLFQTMDKVKETDLIWWSYTISYLITSYFLKAATKSFWYQES